MASILGRIAAPACRARASAWATRARAASTSVLVLAAISMKAFNSSLPKSRYHSCAGHCPPGALTLSKAGGMSCWGGATDCAAHPVRSAAKSMKMEFRYAVMLLEDPLVMIQQSKDGNLGQT